jgi:hypothetical protein
MRRIKSAIGAGFLIFAVSSCGDSERNVILRTDPFYNRHVTMFSEADTGRVLDEVRQFADEKGMDFLISRDGPDRGDFNAIAAGRDINLQVMHIKVAGGGLDVLGYVHGKPTDKDRRLANEFFCRVTRDCLQKF